MISKILKKVFMNVGFDIKRYSIPQNQTARLIKILNDHNVSSVFDIGANEGQFGQELRNLGYKNKIISFEPLSDAYSKLIEVSKEDKFWDLAPRGAIGEEDGEIEINVAGNSASSSILVMMDSHLKAAPTTKKIGVELVSIRKLDTISNTYLNDDSVLFVKIDTQGYEDKVLNGGIETLKKATILQIELSLIELYSGQKLIIEMIEKIKEMGFELWGIEPAFVDSNNGRMLQIDAIFCRPKND